MLTFLLGEQIEEEFGTDDPLPAWMHPEAHVRAAQRPVLASEPMLLGGLRNS